MIQIDLSQTQPLPNGLRFASDAGVLLAPVSRLRIDPSNPRTEITDEDIKKKRADIDQWREEGHGLLKSGLMSPLQCRWDAGATDEHGNVRPDAKLLIWDGGLRFRSVEKDYDWLPVTLDDLNSKEARSAALRTSIVTKAHSDVEQGYAFVDEMKELGLGLRPMAKKYGVDKSYIENRVNLVLKCPVDVQHFIAAHPELDIMSHALAVRAVNDQSERAFLLELAAHGASVKEIQREIERAKEERERKTETRHAPDKETQSRQSRAAIEGSAPMSRGEQITGHTNKEATQEAQAAAANAIGNLETMRQWVARGGKVPDSELLILQHKIAEIIGTQN